jgi:hypothetical protein
MPVIPAFRQLKQKDHKLKNKTVVYMNVERKKRGWGAGGMAQVI